MKRQLVLTLVLSLAMQTGAMAQGFRQMLRGGEPGAGAQSYYNQIYKFATEDSVVRGGGKTGKALGMYAGGNNVVYKSGYAKVDPKVQAEFACALNNFIINSGGGYENYKRNSAATGLSDPVVTYTPLDKKLQQNEPWARSFVPYTKQEQFAKSWWERQNPQFSKMGFVWKDGWVNDSILDGNLLISREIIQNNGANAAMYNSAVFAKLLKKE